MTKKKLKQEQVLSKEEKMKSFKGRILHKGDDDKYLKRTGLYERTVLRRLRYWCFKFRNAQINGTSTKNAPKGLKKFVESLPGFADWEYFAVSWDVYGDNPFMVVLRLQSVWEEWDQVMNRVAIPIDTPPKQLAERLKALEDEFARKEAKKR